MYIILYIQSFLLFKSNKNLKHLSRQSGLICEFFKSFILQCCNSFLWTLLFFRLTTCFFMSQTLPSCPQTTFSIIPSSFQIHNDRLCSSHRNRGVEKLTRSLFSPKANKCLFDQLTMVTTALSLPLRTPRFI